MKMPFQVLKNKKLNIVVLTLLSFSFFSSCKKGEIDEIQEAQYCLNKAAPGQAAACVTGLESKSSQDAKKLVCASIYIDEGFATISELVDALDSMDGGGSGCTGGTCSPSLNAMTTLKFSGSSSTERNAKLEKAINYCAGSGVSSYSAITSIFGIGTLMANIDPNLNGGSNAGDIEAVLTQLTPVDLGNVVLATYATSCQQGGSTQGLEDFCAEVGYAVSNTNGSAAAVGTCLQAKLADPAATCP